MLERAAISLHIFNSVQSLMDGIKTESGCCKLSKLPANAATVAMNYQKSADDPRDMSSETHVPFKSAF